MPTPLVYPRKLQHTLEHNSGNPPYPTMKGFPGNNLVGKGCSGCVPVRCVETTLEFNELSRSIPKSPRPLTWPPNWPSGLLVPSWRPWVNRRWGASGNLHPATNLWRIPTTSLGGYKLYPPMNGRTYHGKTGGKTHSTDRILFRWQLEDFFWKFSSPRSPDDPIWMSLFFSNGLVKKPPTSFFGCRLKVTNKNPANLHPKNDL